MMKNDNVVCNDNDMITIGYDNANDYDDEE